MVMMIYFQICHERPMCISSRILLHQNFCCVYGPAMNQIPPSFKFSHSPFNSYPDTLIRMQSRLSNLIAISLADGQNQAFECSKSSAMKNDSRKFQIQFTFAFLSVPKTSSEPKKNHPPSTTPRLGASEIFVDPKPERRNHEQPSSNFLLILSEYVSTALYALIV